MLRLVSPAGPDTGTTRTDLAPVLAAALADCDLASYQDTHRPEALLRLLGHCADPTATPAIEAWWARVRTSIWAAGCGPELKHTLDVPSGAGDG